VTSVSAGGTTEAMETSDVGAAAQPRIGHANPASTQASRPAPGRASLFNARPCLNGLLRLLGAP
jgi:hypothetical protein